MKTAYNETKKTFGYETGGQMKQLNSGAMQVTGAPNEIDGNQINYKGQDIKLDYNEVLDTDKDRVISDKYFNPYTGKKISEEVKSVEKKIGFLEKNRTNDVISNRTKEMMNKQVDGLYSIQEMVANASGDRQQSQQPMQQPEGYAYGGGIPDLNMMANALKKVPKEIGVPNGDPYNMFNMVNSNAKISPQLPLSYSAQNVNKSRAYSSIPNTYNTNPVNPNGETFDSTNNLVNMLPQRNFKVGQDTFNMNTSPQQVTSQTPSQYTEIPNLKENIPFVPPKVKKPGFLSDGDKISMYGGIASMIPKAIEAFDKVQVEPYRLQNTPITQQQLDPTQALYNSNKEYRDMLYNVNENSGTVAGANAMRQAAFSSKLGADNNIISDYSEKNKGLMTQYEERLAQRQGANNQSMNQTDDLNSRNRGVAQQMRMGFYNDIAGMAKFLGTAKNQRQRDEMMIRLRTKLSPEIWANMLKDDPELASQLGGLGVVDNKTKTTK
jgi:hypothetical protein